MASQAGTFIRQDGVTSRYHARISAEEWELHKTMIEDLHNDGETREDIRNALIQERQFSSKVGLLYLRLHHWRYIDIMLVSISFIRRCENGI